MQTELTKAKQNAKLKIKYANENLKMICKTKTKQNKMLEDKDGQDDAHSRCNLPKLRC